MVQNGRRGSAKGVTAPPDAGDEGFATAIIDVLRRFPASPTPIHRALAELPGSTFLTTNYDVLLEAALAAQTNTRPVAVLLSDIDRLRRFTAGQVLKLHGDIDHPKTVVLSSEDYFRTRHTAARVWKEELKKLAKAPSQLLFVGYGYGDIDVLPVLNELRAPLGGALHAPFWVDVNGFRQRAKAGAAGLREVLLASSNSIEPWLRKLGEAIRQSALVPSGVDTADSDEASRTGRHGRNLARFKPQRTARERLQVCTRRITRTRSKPIKRDSSHSRRSASLLGGTPPLG